MGLVVTVTGADGFIGRNLCLALKRRNDIVLRSITKKDTSETIKDKLLGTDLIFHLAGCNRPKDESEFDRINHGFTNYLTSEIVRLKIKPRIVFSSSMQALFNNPYGISKLKAEKELKNYSHLLDVPIYIYRLTNVFGKWSRPNYNSVVSTFCYKIAHDLPINIIEPKNTIRLNYIDDVVRHFINHLSATESDQGVIYQEVSPTFAVSLEDLSNKLYTFKNTRSTLEIPDFADLFTKYLFATYSSYLDNDNLAYNIKNISDNRGTLTELLKSKHCGQIFVSTTHPGVTRGNHFHNTKVEKFIVLKGEAIVRVRHLAEETIVSYHVSGDNIQIIDIPPGYTHNIENIGEEDMVVMFWANEIFDSGNPDTQYVPV